MPAGSLADADPLAEARTWLLTRSRVTDLVGQRVGPYNEPPYPCLRLTDVPGNDRLLRGLIAPSLQIEALGDLDGKHGKPVLRRLLYIALEELALLPSAPVTDPTSAVVTNVVSMGGGGWVPLPTGQPRYLATVAMYMHPGRAPEGP